MTDRSPLAPLTWRRPGRNRRGAAAGLTTVAIVVGVVGAVVVREPMAGDLAVAEVDPNQDLNLLRRELLVSPGIPVRPVLPGLGGVDVTGTTGAADPIATGDRSGAETAGPARSGGAVPEAAIGELLRELDTEAPPAPSIVAEPDEESLAALPDLAPGSSGEPVRLLQRRLNELGFRAGPADGVYSSQVGSAVLAFTKHEGLTRRRSAGREVWDRLWDLQGAAPSMARRMPRVEADLDRQIAFLVLSPTETWILNISSGGNYYYTGSNGRRTWAATPPGEFVVERRVDGIRHAPLGRLYRPLYFNGGIAIHGSNNVPSFADSHGCLRVSNQDLDWLWDEIPDGSPVIVHTSMGPAAQHSMFTNHLPADAYASALLGSA